MCAPRAVLPSYSEWRLEAMAAGSSEDELIQENSVVSVLHLKTQMQLP